MLCHSPHPRQPPFKIQHPPVQSMTRLSLWLALLMELKVDPNVPAPWLRTSGVYSICAHRRIHRLKPWHLVTLAFTSIRNQCGVVLLRALTQVLLLHCSSGGLKAPCDGAPAALLICRLRTP